MGLSLYTWLLRLALPLVLIRLVWRGFRNSNYWRRWPERFGFVTGTDNTETIWIHAVSVGEVRAAEPLVKNLLQHHPDYHIHVTTMTPTGSVQVQRSFSQRVSHCYVPYDYPASVRRFMRRIKPKILITMETELWPNMFSICQQSSVPVLVANARMSEKSMLRYQRYPVLAKQTLGTITMVAAQTQSDADRMEMLGLDRDHIRVTGSIKFDIDVGEDVLKAGKQLRKQWGENRKIWVAASTHEDEEQRLLPVFRKLKAQFPDLLLVVVPRHPERFDRVWKLCKQSGLKVARRSTNEDITDSTDILLGDTMGELMKFFVVSDVAFIGGSLVPLGGHNPLEALAVATPVVFGPSMYNFEDIKDRTLSCNAGKQITDETELYQQIRLYLSDPAEINQSGKNGRAMVEDNKGAINMIEIMVETMLSLSST